MDVGKKFKNIICLTYDLLDFACTAIDLPFMSSPVWSLILLYWFTSIPTAIVAFIFFFMSYVLMKRISWWSQNGVLTIPILCGFHFIAVSYNVCPNILRKNSFKEILWVFFCWNRWKKRRNVSIAGIGMTFLLPSNVMLSYAKKDKAIKVSKTVY